MAFPGTYNFNYYRGDTFEFIIRPKDANGDSFPLDNFNTATFIIADKRGPTTTKYTASAVINTANDIVTCTIGPSVGRNLTTANTWVYDVQISNATLDRVYTILTGNITVTNDITGA